MSYNILPTATQREVMATFAPKFLGSQAPYQKMYTASSIPQCVISYAKSKYVANLTTNSIIGFMDTSLRGNGQAGFLFCSDAIYYSTTGFFASWIEIKFDNISDIYYDNTNSEPKFHHVKIVKNSGNTLALNDYSFGNKEALAQYLRIVTGFDPWENESVHQNDNDSTISFAGFRCDFSIVDSCLKDHISYLTNLQDRVYTGKSLTFEIKETISKKTQHFSFGNLLAVIDTSILDDFSSCFLVYENGFYKATIKGSIGFKYNDLKELRLSKKEKQKDCDATIMVVLKDGTTFEFGDALNKTVFVSFLQKVFGMPPLLSLDKIEEMVVADRNKLYDTIAATVSTINTYCENYPHNK